MPEVDSCRLYHTHGAPDQPCTYSGRCTVWRVGVHHVWPWLPPTAERVAARVGQQRVRKVVAVHVGVHGGADGGVRPEGRVGRDGDAGVGQHHERARVPTAMVVWVRENLPTQE